MNMTHVEAASSPASETELLSRIRQCAPRPVQDPEPALDFIEFMSDRLSVSREKATAELGALLVQYQARERYEISMLSSSQRSAA